VTKFATVIVQVLPLAACFNVNGFAPTSLRTSSFRASNDAAVNTKPALAVTPKARAGRAPVSVRPFPSLCKCAGPCHARHVLAWKRICFQGRWERGLIWPNPACDAPRDAATLTE